MAGSNHQPPGVTAQGAAVDPSLVTTAHVIYRIVRGWLALRDERPIAV